MKLFQGCLMCLMVAGIIAATLCFFATREPSRSEVTPSVQVKLEAPKPIVAMPGTSGQPSTVAKVVVDEQELELNKDGFTLNPISKTLWK